MNENLHPQPAPSDERSSRPSAPPPNKRTRGRPKIEKALGDLSAQFPPCQPNIQAAGEQVVMRVSAENWPNQIAAAMSDMNRFERYTPRG